MAFGSMCFQVVETEPEEKPGLKLLPFLCY